MSAIEVKIENLDTVIKALEGGKADIQNAARRGMTMATAFGQSFMAEYPPAPPNSSYRRTGTLGRSWTTRVFDRGAEIHGLIGSNVPYAFVVQDEDRQARVHKGRWQTVQDLTRDPQASTITQMIQEEVDRVAENINSVR